MQCGEARHIKLKVQHKAENRTPVKRELHPIEAYCNMHARQDKFHARGARLTPHPRPFLPAPTFVAILTTIEKTPGNTSNSHPGIDLRTVNTPHGIFCRLPFIACSTTGSGDAQQIEWLKEDAYIATG